MLDITLQQIETFLLVAEHLSFSDAAKAMYISQPALSKIISRLEKGIDVVLFIRKSNGIELSKEGEYLYYQLRPLCNKMTKALENVHQLSSDPKKILRLAFHTSYDFVQDIGPLGKTRAAYEEKYPDVAITQELFEFKELRSALISGDVDLVYSTSFTFEDVKSISYKNLELHHFYMLMSAKHPLAAYEQLHVSELNNEVFYFVSPSFANDSEFERCGQMGFTPKSIQHLPNFPSVITAVRQGKGMTFCGNISTTLIGSDIKYFEISNIPDAPYNAVAWRTNDVSKEALDFINMLPEL